MRDQDIVLKLASQDKVFREILIQKLAKKVKMPYSWGEFWRKVYKDGKKRVKNPNPKGKLKDVSANTALKDKRFQQQVYKEFKEWDKKRESQKKKLSPKEKKMRQKEVKEQRKKERKKSLKDLKQEKHLKELDKLNKREKDLEKGPKRKEHPSSFPPKIKSAYRSDDFKNSLILKISKKMPADFQKWLKNQQGKTIKNPNPKGKKKEVSYSTAMKDPKGAQVIIRMYMKEKKKKEKDNSKKPRKEIENQVDSFMKKHPPTGFISEKKFNKVKNFIDEMTDGLNKFDRKDPGYKKIEKEVDHQIKRLIERYDPENKFGDLD
jgi:hypothetical protein